MANGNHALQLVTSDPPPAQPAAPDIPVEIGSADAATASDTGCGIVGELVADLVVQFGQGLIDHEFDRGAAAFDQTADRRLVRAAL